MMLLGPQINNMPSKSLVIVLLSEKDALIEELCEKEDSFSAKDKKESVDKEAAEEIRKKAMERMASKKKSNESAGGSAKNIRRSGCDAVEFLKEKAQSRSK